MDDRTTLGELLGISKPAEKVEVKKVAYDYHNNNLVAELQEFVKDSPRSSMMTDLEWLDAVAEIVSKRKFSWGVTDCSTGLTYRQGK